MSENKTSQAAAELWEIYHTHTAASRLSVKTTHMVAIASKYQRTEAASFDAWERMGQEIERARIAGEPVAKAMVVSHRELGEALSFDPLA